jgi:hypothetical protein
MKLLAIRKEPAYLECIHNRDHSIIWDSDDIVFVIDSPNHLKIANLNSRAKEILLWNTKFEFQCPYIGYEDEWEIFEQF